MLRGLHFLSRLRVNRCTAIFVCLAVIIVTLVSPVSFARRPQGQGQAQAANGNARKVKPLPPEKGAPKLALPNLDEIRTQRENNPQIKPPVPSTVRARRKQLPSSARNSAEPVSRSRTRTEARAHHSTSNAVALNPQNDSSVARAMARLDPLNQTGNQLLARDCEWSLPILSLPGRAGLDLNLTLSYSSQVWTPAGNSIYFDEDQGNVSPGFSIGFPRIEDVFFDSQAQVNARLLVSGTGQRVELRQVSTYVYESADSSYLQLTDNNDSPHTLTLRTTDGTQMKYEAFVSGWQATKITDRNGNYISINYYTNTGDIQNITDTLGRVITFEYVNGKLNRLLQNWNGGLHEWATFGWTTEWFTPNFSLTAAGAYSGVAALTQVGLPDGSYYTFDYAVAGQVKDIHRFSSDHVQRSSMAYDYTSPTDDCPRIYQTRASVDHWTGYNGVPAELTTQFLVYTNGWYQTILPDGTAYQEYYGSGWQKGLVLSTETWVRPDPNSSYARQKVTATQWTQDNESVSYQTNPRVKQTDIYDASWNDRRTTIDYQGPFGLPATITEFNADASTPLRRTVLEYKTDSYYNSRRLVGLLATKTVYDTNSNVVARTSYDYDAQGAIQSQAQYATQHDSGYDASFLLRGNVTSITRWDASDPNNQSKRLINNMTYDVAGNLLTTTDAGNPTRHTSTISYADQFSDSSNHNTFAYPTTLTDADGYSSYVQYNFDFGLKTLVTTPQPNGISNTAGPQQLIEYDSALQTQRVTSLSTGAYIRYLYGADYVEELHSEKISLTTRSPRNGSTARAILMQWPRTIPALRAAIKRS